MSTMGGIYLYGIVDRKCTLPAQPGLQGRKIYPLIHRSIAGVVSHLQQLEQCQEADLLAHARVVERVMTVASILPFRFGTVLSSEAAVVELLGHQFAAFREGLDQVRGRVELGLRAYWSASCPALDRKAPSLALSAYHRRGKRSVHDFLRGWRHRAEWERRGEELIAGIHGQLEPLAVESTLEGFSSEGELLTASYLVEEAAVEDLRAEVRAMMDQYREVDLYLSGPWPPYSFVPHISR